MLKPPVIEDEEGESDQVESDDSDQVETNVDVGPGKVIQHIAVIGPLLITQYYQVILFKNLLVIKEHSSTLPYLALGSSVIIELVEVGK